MHHRERLLPPWWLFAVCVLVAPAALLVLLPISPGWGVAVGVVLVAVAWVALVVLSPVVEVTDGVLRAGSAAIPVAALGDPVALDAEASHAAMRTDFDAAAYHCTVAWTSALVRVAVVDDDDPTTAWIVSTRRAAALVDAISTAQRAAGTAS